LTSLFVSFTPIIKNSNPSTLEFDGIYCTIQPELLATMPPKKKTTKSLKPDVAPEVGGENKPKPNHISKDTVKHASEGCIVWLPAKKDIIQGSHIDPKLNDGAFDHPAIIVSAPTPAKLNSVARIAIVGLFLWRDILP
jgi:hypothetical protein